MSSIVNLCSSSRSRHLGLGLVAAFLMLAVMVQGLFPSPLAPGAITRLVIIDDAVSNPVQLASGFATSPGTAVIHLPPGRDGLADVARALAPFHGLAAIHILSHGHKGVLQLGGEDIGIERLRLDHDALSAIGKSLRDGGDILLYGCSIGEGSEGADYVAQFAKLTGRDVAASSDQTGSSALGGNWKLEQSVGQVQTAALAPVQWNALLSQNNTTTWTLGANVGSNTLTIGASSVTATVTLSGHSTATTSTTLTNETLNNIAVFSPAVQNTASFGVQYNWDNAPEAGTNLASDDGGTVVMTITFSQAVKDPILHLDRIGGSDGTNQNSSQMTLQTSGISLTRLAGTGHFSVAGSVITNNLSGTAIATGYTSESSTTTNLGTAAGSVRLNGTFTTVSFLMAPAPNTTEGAGGDAIEMKLTYDPVPVAQPDSFTSYMNAVVSGNLYSDNGSGADSDFNTDTLTISQINGAAYTVGTPITLANGSLTITNATTGTFSFTPTPGFFGTQTFTYTVTDANGGISTATVTITVQRTSLTLVKTSIGGVGGFTFTGNNGWSSQTITTVTSGAAVTGATQSLAAPSTATTITESIPAGYYVSAISCSGLAGGTATPNLATGAVTLDATATAVNNAITCGFTNTKLPTLQIRKISLGAVGGFSFSGTNGFGADTITTVTQGAAVNGATKILTAINTATSVTETIPATYFISAISCTGLGSGTATTNLTTGVVQLDTAATAPGNAIVCTYTNTKEAPGLTVVKSASTAGPVSVGNVITYTFQVTNTGNRTMTGIQVSDTFNGTGIAPVPRNEALLTDAAPAGDSTDVTANNGVWSTLAPGDVIRFTATYTVTQTDIDTRQ